MFIVTVVVVIGVFVCNAVGKRIGDEMAAWVIANEDDDDAPAPTFGADVGERHRPSLGRYRWYASQYRQIKQAKSEPPTLANQFAAVQIAKVGGGLLVLVTWLLAFSVVD